MNEKVGYRFPAWVINTVLAGILGGIITIGGYMVRWNADDLAFKREILTRVTAVESLVTRGVLPRADERINELRKDLDEHLEESRTGYARIRENERDIARLKEKIK